MPRPTIIPLAPRVLNAATLCAYLGRSETWFAEHRDELARDGFPHPHPILGGYDRVAVDRWLDRASPILAPSGPAPARSWDQPARPRGQ